MKLFDADGFLFLSVLSRFGVCKLYFSESRRR